MGRTERRVSRGAILVHERVLSEQDIVDFAQLTGDLGVHHLAGGPEPPIAQGLLVAALPTKLGGDLSFMGRVMRMEFLRPVVAGQLVRAEVRVDELVRGRRGWDALLISEVSNQQGELVMRGEVEGRLSDELVDEERRLQAFRVRAGLDEQCSWIDIVNAVAAIPYGRPAGKDPTDVVASWRGTCSTKHSLLCALLAEGWPELTAHTWHRVYRVDRRLAREMFGARAAAAVPESGLVDVHTYLTVTVGVEPVRVDVTFALRERWTGDGQMQLRCGEGFDVRGGRFPNRRKRELVSLHCDPTVREPFIAALSEPLDPSRVADV
jgi:acyl dehydratase